MELLRSMLLLRGVDPITLLVSTSWLKANEYWISYEYKNSSIGLSLLCVLVTTFFIKKNIGIFKPIL
jgi:hypothetical protein